MLLGLWQVAMDRVVKVQAGENVAPLVGELNRSVKRPALDDQAHVALVRAFVKWLRAKAGVLTVCEVPYNFYGERGVVDVLALVRPSLGEPWSGVACELKPSIHDLGATMRQVKKAERYFRLPSDLVSFGQAALRFPLILEANGDNFTTASCYAEVLDGIEVHFFSQGEGLRNPFERAWLAKASPVQTQRVTFSTCDTRGPAQAGSLAPTVGLEAPNDALDVPPLTN